MIVEVPLPPHVAAALEKWAVEEAFNSPDELASAILRLHIDRPVGRDPPWHVEQCPVTLDQALAASSFGLRTGRAWLL